MELFDGREFEIPVEEQTVYMGEQPAMTAADWRLVASQLHGEHNWTASQEAWRKADRAERIQQVAGQLALDNMGIV